MNPLSQFYRLIIVSNLWTKDTSIDICRIFISYNIRINAIKKSDNRLTNVIFYHFSKSTIIPRHLSTRIEWQQVYNNFRILCSPTSKRNNNVLREINTINSVCIESTISKVNKKKNIHDEIGNYFNCSEATNLFRPWNNKSIEDCLSRYIDLLDEILNEKINISTIINKANEENCQWNKRQYLHIYQRINYLRIAYLNILNCDLNEPIMS